MNEYTIELIAVQRITVDADNPDEAFEMARNQVDSAAWEIVDLYSHCRENTHAKFLKAVTNENRMDAPPRSSCPVR